MMKKALLTLAALLISLAVVSTAVAREYDLIINNGRVMDPETSLDAVRNIGISDGRIALITEKDIVGKETIDAKGHVVSPGFIDMHNHNSGAPFGMKLALRDGVSNRYGTPENKDGADGSAARIQGMMKFKFN